MSVFLSRIDSYCARYGVDRADRLRLLAHYPLFKLAYWARYGRGRRGGLARSFLARLGSVHLDHAVRDALGRRRTLRLSFSPSDVASFEEVFFGEEYRLAAQVDDVRSLVDLGANTGMAAFFLLLAHPEIERAVLVEANPNLLPGLCESVTAFGAAGMELVHSAVGSGRADSIGFDADGDHRLGAVSEGGGARVPNTGLRRLLDAHGLEEVDLLKMDIEGAEHVIAREDPHVFSRFRHVVAEVHGPSNLRAEFVNTLGRVGLDVVERRAGGEGYENVFAVRRTPAARG